MVEHDVSGKELISLTSSPPERGEYKQGTGRFIGKYKKRKMNNDNNQQAKQTTPFPREGFGDGAVIERKLEFDEVRTLLKGHCISKLGTDRVEEMTFMTDAEQIRSRLAQVNEIGQILDTELQMPGEDFCDMRLAIKRIRVEGVYLEESEMWELKRSL